MTTSPARTMTAGFEGRFMCRLATDPDPNDERRGRSGYTMALTTEHALDQVIRLQPDPYVHEHLREPGKQLGYKVGVTVRWVELDGKRWKKPEPHPLVGGAVSLQGRHPGFEGPIFESRNNIVGSDDTLAFVINPFELVIDSPAGGPRYALRAIDHLNPQDEHEKLWEIADPSDYGRRLPMAFDAGSAEVMQAIGVFDGYAYFRGRRAFLTKQMADLQKIVDAGGDTEAATLAFEQAKSRLYQLEFWGDRVINKLGFRLEWQFNVNGPQTVEHAKVAEEALKVRVDTHRPWRVSFWFGGWDGDLLIGYMRGTLTVPLLGA